MAGKSSYFVTSAEANWLEFGFTYNTVTLNGEAITFNGSSGVDTVFVQSGVSFDFVNAKTAIDVVYLGGNWADYARGRTVSALTLTTGSTAVSVARGTGSDSDLLVLADGSVNTNTAWSNHSLSNPGLDTSQKTGDAVVPATLSGSLRTFAQAATEGSVFASFGAGVSLTANGTDFKDVVYVADGGNVDATNLKGGVDYIYLRGTWSDYTKTRDISSITFTRTIDGNTETIRVARGTPSDTDLVLFRDGALAANVAWSNNTATAFAGIAGYIAPVAGNDDTTTPLGVTPIAISLVAGDDRIDPAEGAANVIISGTAPAGAAVTLAFGTIGKTTAADGNGAWQVTLTPAEIGALANGGYTVTVGAVDSENTSLGSAERLVTVNAKVNGVRTALLTIQPNAADGVADAAAKAALVKAAAGANVLVVTGVTGVDTVFVEAGANVDLTSLGAGADTIYLPARWSDYAITASGLTLVLTREIDGQAAVERIVVAAGSGEANDYRLVFADGDSVGSNDVRRALQGYQDGWDNTVSGIAGYRTDPVPAGMEARVSAAAGATIAGRVGVPDAGAADYADRLVTAVEVTFNGATRTVVPDQYGAWSASFAAAEMPAQNGMSSLAIVAKNAAGAQVSAETRAVFVVVDSAALTVVDLSFAAGGPVAENAAGAAAGTLTPAGGTFTAANFTVDDARFEVVAAGGVFTLGLKAGQALDYEAAASLAVRVAVSGADGRTAARLVTVQVGDVNEAPAANAAADAVLAGLVLSTAATGTLLDLADLDGQGTPVFTDPDTSGTAFATLSYSAQLITALGANNAVGGGDDTYGALPVWLDVTAAGLVQVASGQTPVAGSYNLHLTATDGATTGLTATRDIAFEVAAGVTLTNAALQGDTNLDLRTDLMLFASEAVSLVAAADAAGLTITLVNTTVANGSRNMVLDLTSTADRGLISIVNGSSSNTIAIDMPYDLDAGANYRLEVSDGAFVSQADPAKGSLALGAVTGIGFSAFAPTALAAGGSGSADLWNTPDASTGSAATSAVTWHNLAGYGSRGTDANAFAPSKAVTGIDVGAGAHVLYLGAITAVGSNLFTTGVDSWAQVNNLGANDRIYFDDRVNSATTYGLYSVANSVSLTTYDEGAPGVDGNRASVSPAVGTTSGLWLDFTLDATDWNATTLGQNYANAWSGGAEPTFGTVYGHAPVLVA